MAFLAPIFGAIGSLFGAVGSFLGGLGFIGKALLGIGLNLAAQYLLRRNQRPEPSGIQLQVQYGTDTPRQVACGLVATAGHEIHVNTYGEDNKWLQKVYQLSDYPIDGFVRLAINGEWVSVDFENPHATRGWPIVGSELAGRSWLKIYDGRQTVADPGLVNNAKPSGRWSSDAVGLGCAYAVFTAMYDREKPVSPPDLLFEFRGARLYDWRKDSTVGGDGSHRWNDPSTWEFTENPIVIEYNYRRGLSINGDLFCGMGMDPADLPLDKYTIAANICDEIVTGGEPRYRCSIMLDSMATHGENIEAIMKSCGGMVIDAVEGSWPLVGTSQPVVATITDDDLVMGQPVRWQAKRSMSELVNSISGTYPEREQLWAMVGYDPVIASDAIAADRRTRDLGMDFPTVRSARQAKQLASIYLKENRLEATAEITVRPRWQMLKPGDWITWNSARYGSKTYIIVEATLYSLESDTPRCKRLVLQERAANMYDPVTAPAVVVPVPPGKPTYLQQVSGLIVSGVMAGAEGRHMPALQASWDTITDVTVSGVEVRWYPVEEPTAIAMTSVPVDTTSALLIEGVVSNTEYSVQTRLITDPVRTVAWSSPVNAWSPDQGYTDVDYSGLVEEVDNLTAWAGHNVREIIEELRRNTLLTIDQDAANFRDKQELRRELSSTFGRARAQWLHEIEVATGPDSALARRIEELEVEVGDNLAQAVSALSTQITSTNNAVTALSSQLTALETQIDDDLASAVSSLQSQISTVDGKATANATAISNLTAQVGDIASSVTIRGEVSASPGDGWARWIARVATGDGEDLSEAVFAMDAKAGQSRLVLLADQTVFGTLSGENIQPIVFEAGQGFKMNISNVGTVTAGVIQSPDGRFVINLADGSLRISD